MLFDDADGTFKFACTPAQHSSSRSQVDNMATLWSSWVVEGPSGRRFFCAGDTGYTSQYNNPTKAECPAFKQIGQVYGPIDLAALPIGAYRPEHYMCGLNVQPEDSVRIHEDVGAVKSVGIHWGTFMITSEPVDEPPQRFTQEMEKRNHGGEYAIISSGETIST
ncbi:hypothetical protein BX070DRAFT_221086 [Coemansia spiralis]|nr:hypothetical protein BX070DRAFT_221086 [Coemansia spiralis]